VQAIGLFHLFWWTILLSLVVEVRTQAVAVLVVLELEQVLLYLAGQHTPSLLVLAVLAVQQRPQVVQILYFRLSHPQVVVARA
jgi:hypothetical protein